VVKLNLQNNITTTQELRAVIMDMRKYAKWYSQTRIKHQVVGAQEVEPYQMSPHALEILKQAAGGQPVSQPLLDDILTTLTKLEGSAPKVTITLAALPSNKLKQTLGNWFREHTDPETLVDFKFNATILGGMVVQYKSRVYDWSFRSKIVDARSKFPEILRHV